MRRPWLPGLMLLLLLMAIAGSTAQNDDDEDEAAGSGQTPPTYHLKFKVTYNMTDKQNPSKRCGEYYASTCLGNLLNAEQKILREDCSSGQGKGATLTIIVWASGKIINYQIGGKWVFKFYAAYPNPDDIALFDSSVAVNITMNITSDRGNLLNAKKSMESCAANVIATLSDITSLDQRLGEISLTTLEEETDLGCAEAVISQPQFDLQSASWICAENYTLEEKNQNEDRLRCVIRDEDATTPGQSTTMTTSSLDNTTPAGNVEPTTTQQGDNVQTTTSASDTNHFTTTDNARTTGLDNLETVHNADTTTSRDSLLSSPSYSSVSTSSSDSSTSSIMDATLQPSTHQNVPLPATTQVPFIPLPWGIEMESPPAEVKINMREGGPDKNLTFIAWANQTDLCRGRGNDCRAVIRIYVEDFPNDNIPRCRDGDPISQLVLEDRGWEASGSGVCTTSLDDSAVSLDKAMQYTVTLRARLDGSYDGVQKSRVVIGLRAEGANVEENFASLVVEIKDEDRKATCQSINDPHITTFDGLEFNNFYQGEFVLYKHTSLPFGVHVFYQSCSPDVQYSCNCAVAIQSGDDVIVFDRCYRDKKPFKRFNNSVSKAFNAYVVQLFLQNDLTPGTYVYMQDEGKKYYVYLPNGVVVKVATNNDLVNVWVMPSPSDMDSTLGLCGLYNGDASDDCTLPDGSITGSDCTPTADGDRPAPDAFNLAWRVKAEDSIMQGVQAPVEYQPHQYCDCHLGMCGYGMDLSQCGTNSGEDVTDKLVKDSLARRPQTDNDVDGSSERRRKRRNTDNAIVTADPIKYDPNWKPKKVSWENEQNEVYYSDFCRQYIVDNYTIGQLCKKNVPGINFQQEITTCLEDIKITKNTSWADSAREAMKEQCTEQMQRNGSLDTGIMDDIMGQMCPGDCSGHGECVQGECRCAIGYRGADCSLSSGDKPYISEMPDYGLCDLQYMDCDTVMVYGDRFIRNNKLTCHFQKCEVGSEPSKTLPLDIFNSSLGIYINFNTVECRLPSVEPFLVSVSNDGVREHASDPLLFIPFDSKCSSCSTNDSTCVKTDDNHCVIDHRCYMEGQKSPNNNCLICQKFNNKLEWTTVDADHCAKRWVNMPDWSIALLAALGGSIFGVIVGFLLYKCCCRGRKSSSDQDESSDTHMTHGVQEYSDILHRNRGLPVFSSNRSTPMVPPLDQHHNYDNSYFYDATRGRGMDNGIDSSTYF